MIVAMNLNAPPVPEQDEDFEKIHVEEFHEPKECIETGADIACRLPFIYNFLSFYPSLAS